MHTHTCAYINAYAHIYTDIHIYIYIHIHMHLYTNTCTHIYIRMHMHTYVQIENPSNNTSMCQGIHRRTYASICICMHTHTYMHIHICAQSVASVSQDVYVGVNIHLCNIHNCPCTSAQNTCKVHVTLTAKNAHIYIPTRIHIRMHMHTKTHAHA